MIRSMLITSLILLAGHYALAADGDAVPDPGKRPTKIWSRTGPLGETPKRVTDAFPLSDQENKGGWVEFEPMSDEFEGNRLDLDKWELGIAPWKGRPPAPLQR